MFASGRVSYSKLPTAFQLCMGAGRGKAPGVIKLRSVLLPALVCAFSAVADEGMWLLNDFPSAKVRAAYGFAPSQQWLDRVRLGAVEPSPRCSARLVSTHRPAV